MSTRRLRSGLCATATFAAIALAAGCSSSDSPTTPPGPGGPIDLASVFAQMSSAGLSASSGAAALTGIPALPASPTVAPSACNYSSATGGFVCPSGSSGGVNFSLTYYLYDASGHTQSAADSKTTDGVRTVSDLSGTVTTTSGGTNATSVFTDHSDMTLKGLLGTTRTLNGTSKAHFDLTTTGATTLHSVDDVNTTTTNVVFPAPGATNPWPLSGTIAADIKSTTMAGSSSFVLNIQSVITFNGTSIVTIATTAAGTTRTCHIDLTGKTAPVC